MAEQVSARCTHCTPAPSTPSSSMRACRLDDDRRPPLCCARQIPAMLASKRSRPHPARAATAHTPIPATRVRQTRARARRRLRPGRPPVQPPRPKNMACRCPTKHGIGLLQGDALDLLHEGWGGRATVRHLRVCLCVCVCVCVYVCVCVRARARMCTCVHAKSWLIRVRLLGPAPPAWASHTLTHSFSHIRVDGCV